MTTQSQPRDPAADDTTIREPVSDHARPAPPPRRRSRVRWIVAAAVGLFALVAAGLYLTGYALAGDKLPKNASVSGVPVGGLDRAAAADKLKREIGPRARRDLAVSVVGKRYRVDPATAGLRVDYGASVARAGGGRSLDPRQIWRVLTGGSDTDVVVTVDKTKLKAAVEALAERTDRPPRNATLGYGARTRVKVTKAAPGVRLDQSRAVAALADAYLGPQHAVELAAEVSGPEITTAEVRRLADSFARPAVAAPIIVRAAGVGRFSLSPRMIAHSLSFEPADGALVPRLHADRLHRRAGAAMSTVGLTKPRNATVRLVKGRPKVIPAVDGTTITAENLAQAVEPALPATGRTRTVSVTLTGAKARFSTADAKRLGVRRVIGEFTTYFPYAEYRNVNIGRAAEKMNNTLLRPGEVFSLNRVVGERTKANGFTEGYIIKGGRFRKELGGGVSQSATTTFNAMFFAGLKDVQHQPHQLYIDRYPAGREATVAWPSLDLKFANDTKYGVLVQAFITRSTPSRQGSITVKMWSSKTYDKVASSKLRRSNVTTGRTITDKGPNCEPTEPVVGFDVNYERLFYLNAKLVRTEPFRWRYAPTDKVVCASS